MHSHVHVKKSILCVKAQSSESCPAFAGRNTIQSVEQGKPVNSPILSLSLAHMRSRIPLLFIRSCRLGTHNSFLCNIKIIFYPELLAFQLIAMEI